MSDSNALKIIEKIFKLHYKKGKDRVDFTREDIVLAAKKLGIEPPKNLGGVIYTYKTKDLPPSITRTAPKEKYWWLTAAGKGKYCFSLHTTNPIICPDTNIKSVIIPESTPGLVKKYSKEDEQALLAMIRYNNILDIFLGISCYSLQNHLRTTVDDIGQIEVDELYVGIDKDGKEYIIPVEAKGINETMGIVQIDQNIKLCEQDFGQLACIPIACQFMDSDSVAIYEFAIQDNVLTKKREVHYTIKDVFNGSIQV